MITNHFKFLNLLDEINKKINKFKKFIIIIFFSLIFAIGIICVKDYGATNDEYNQRLNGFITLNYLGEKFLPDLTKKIKGDKKFPKYEEMPNNLRYYGGPVIHAPLALLEIVFGIEDKKKVFLFKHYIFFLIFFLSLISFFNITKNRFSDWRYGILGVLILFLSPRIFANSFYNNLDIPFMSFIIFSLNFGLLFLNKPTLKNSFFFAIFSAIAIDLRLMGIIVPIALSSILFFESLFDQNKLKKNLSNIFFINILTLIFMIIFWPMLWEDPVKNLIAVFLNLANHPINNYNFYLGEIISVSSTPWHYIPVWIFVTTPFFYSFCSILGLVKFSIDNLKFKKRSTLNQDLFFLLIIFLPILAIIFLNSNLYNGWRHMYFIYPCIIIFSLIGIHWLFKIFKNQKLIHIFQIAIVFFLLNTSFWMIKNHPHQYVYFNKFISKNASKYFELDYAAASYKENLDYLINNEDKEIYNIWNSGQTKLWYPLFSLTDKNRKKFEETDKHKAEYWITNYYLDNQNYDENFFKKYELLNEVLIDGNKINTLFKLKN